MGRTVQESQAALLRRIATRDRAALEEFYDQTAAPLFSVALRIVGDAHEAEEVIQDVFVQIWDKAPGFNPELAAPFSWAMSLTRYRSIDRLRARNRRARLATEFESALEANERGALPESGVLGKEDYMAIRTAVGGLPLEQRQPIELAFFKGLTHLEIAEALKQPLGTIKARIRRGMFKLRESLEAYL